MKTDYGFIFGYALLALGIVCFLIPLVGLAVGVAGALFAFRFHKEINAGVASVSIVRAMAGMTEESKKSEPDDKSQDSSI